jgi:acetyltransferase-like isoleucine patch superfamily enzyme
MPRRWWLFAARQLRRGGKLAIGSGSFVHPRAQIIGRANVVIGANTCISEDCWLNVNHREHGSVGIAIGSNCFIGRHNFFSSGRSIRMADYCLTTIGCRFICASHIADNPRLPYISSGTTRDDSISIGANCFFGAAATVLGNVTIGHGSVIGANALVTSDVPPFSVVVGSPARVIKRYSYARNAWLDCRSTQAGDLDANPPEHLYLEALRAAEPAVRLPWLAAGNDFGSL